MKKISILIFLIVLGWIASTDRFPVKSWLLKKAETLAVEYNEYLPLEMIGKRIFDKNCASCHDNPAMQAPTRESLSLYSRESLMITMEFGKMQAMAAHLSKQKRTLIAHYLAGSDTTSYKWLESNACSDDQLIQNQKSVATNWLSNWGIGLKNRRFVGENVTQINVENVGSLKLQWSMAFPKVNGMRSQPVIIGDNLYIGDRAGKFYQLDRTSGCVINHTDILGGVRSSITLAELSNGKQLLLMASPIGMVYAIDPETLEKVWQQSIVINKYSTVTGSISYHDDTLFVPISTYEVAASGSPDHICCTSHGAVASLNAHNGATIWVWHATQDAVVSGKNREGKPVYGPAGAPVWTTPAIDIKRNRIYFGTGENISEPATGTSDAIVALDIDSGELVWKFQATENDVWNAACLNGGANCPDNPGGDFDFGASVIIANGTNGKDILLAGQKSGEVFALDPEADGEVLWSRRISQGTSNGGVHWGMALTESTLFVPISDPEHERDGYTPQPGITALNINTGELLWKYAAERECEFDPANTPLVGLENRRASAKQDASKQFECSYYFGLSAAATATSKLVFSGGLDGKLRAFDASTGDILWQTETAKPFTAINGVKAHGGALDVTGPAFAGKWMYVQSGYGMFGQLPGNMLLAYRIE
jgi:polyvinyl alcohol dehydrogenase (cytochrome)